MNGTTTTGPNIFRNLGRAGLVAMAALALVSCGGGKGKPKADLAASRVTTIGVNSYLWRASLEALSFMPMLQTDSNGGVIVPLIKPQFELRKEDVGRGGVVRDPLLHEQAVEKIRAFVATMPTLRWDGLIESPILGGEGNKEFLACLRAASV